MTTDPSPPTKKKQVFIRKCQRKEEFFRLHNDCAENEALSACGLAVLAYLMKKPDDWAVNANDICRRFNWEIKKTYKIFNELRELGYMRRSVQRTDEGTFVKWVTELSDEPIFLEENKKHIKQTTNNSYNPLSQKRIMGERHPLSQNPLSGKRDNGDLIYTNKESTNKSITTTVLDTLKPPPSSEPIVVLSLKEKLEERLEKLGIKHTTYNSWFIKLPLQRIEDVLVYVEKRGIENPAGFVVSAINGNWGLYCKENTKSSIPEPPKRFTRAENIDWWLSLSREERQYWISCLKDTDVVTGELLKTDVEKRVSKIPIELYEEENYLSDDFCRNKLMDRMFGILIRFVGRTEE